MTKNTNNVANHGMENLINPATTARTNSTPNMKTGTQRTGGRSARNKQAILEASMAELMAVGYDKFGISNVAKRANVHESTVYRRWTKKEDLLFDACMQFADVTLDSQDSGSLYDDLLYNITAIARLIESPMGNAFMALVVASQTDKKLAELIDKLLESRIKTGQQIFDRAVARGEWQTDFDRHKLFAEVVGPLIAHAFLLKEPLTDKLIKSHVDRIMKS